MTLKQARQACRDLAINEHTSWWSLCWTKHNGYYPAEGYRGKDTNHICWVAKNGSFMYASKENERKHNLKGNVAWVGVDGRRK